MLNLVIAEKPSVAQSIAKVLGCTGRQDGYLEGNGYLVSWCVGHLIELAEPEGYDSKYEKWKKEDLPIIPLEFKYQVSASTKKQFQTLKELMNRSDVTAVTNACDAGREGELIAVERVMIREAIEKCDLDGGILKDTDNPEKHRKNIWTITMMRREYEVFDSFLNTLDGREYTIMTRHLNEKCKVSKIAEELDVADKTVSNLLSDIKSSLRENITPYFREAI